MAHVRQSHPATVSDEDYIRELQAEFKVLESTLIASVYFETCNYEVAREVLDLLNTQAVIDKAGGGIVETSFSDNFGRPRDRNCQGGYPGDCSGPSGAHLHGDRENELIGLGEMFPLMTEFTMRSVWEKCGRDLARTTDELLNTAYFQETGEKGFKGIDGFSEDRIISTKHKKTSRSQFQQNPVSSFTSFEVGNNEPGRSKWEKMNEEIDFLADSCGISKSFTSSIYHSNGGNIGKTISSLLEKFPVEHSEHDLSPNHKTEMDGLVKEFGEELEIEKLKKLLSMCKGNQAYAFLFADFLRANEIQLRFFRKIPTTGNVGSITPAAHKATTRLEGNTKWITVGRSYQQPEPSAEVTRFFNSTGASGDGKAYQRARNEAFQKAAEAYRRSKSDKHMAGAAAFYADIGREYNTKTKQFSDVAAEQLVAQNSNRDTLDLHGVTVSQAVKIARERTNTWWANAVNAEPSRNGSRVKPLVIVTGLGRHSKGGAAKLFPAIVNMLRKENWNFAVEEGQVIVFSGKHHR